MRHKNGSGKTVVSVLLVSAAILITGIRPAHSEDKPLQNSWAWVSGESLPTPVDTKSAQIYPVISATSAIVIDAATATPIIEINPDQPIPPASTTKLMTALVARRTYDLDEVITVTQEAFTQGTTMGLTVGEQVRVRDLLAGLLISSGNDAAFALANNHPKGYGGFIADMNSISHELGLCLTHFNNPSGLDEENHKTTARDLANLTREVMKDPVLRQIVGTQQDNVYDVTGETIHSLFHTHQLLGVVPGVIGVKTGTTPLAGEVLITQWEPSSEEKQLKPIILVTMNSQDRYADTISLLDWSKQNYYWRKWSELSTLNR